MDRQQVSDQISKATLETTDVVGAKRRAFLNAALLEHLATEFSGDLAAIVRTFSEGGQTVFNGVIYDTPEQLTDFHRNFGWDGRGLLSNIGLAQVRADGEAERPLLTAGDDIADVARFLSNGRASYDACDVIEYLLKPTASSR